jgi:ubiquinone/menaquinone biosynthesis C-methylase UbiE
MERKMVSLAPEIEQFYRQYNEQQRLSDDRGMFERLRTEAILARHLPASPAVVIDVGGAAGVYAFPLSQIGYVVHLVDPVALHIEQARAYATHSGISLASSCIGDARNLDFGSSQAGAVLLLGPLYHLTEAGDRIGALREACRVLEPGGVLVAAAISRFVSFIEALSTGAFRDSTFRETIKSDLNSGQHRNPTGNPAYFTTAYFHRPEELSLEIKQAGFDNIRVMAVEGPAWAGACFPNAMTDPIQREKMLQFVSLIETEPSILGASAHLIAVARKPKPSLSAHPA